MPGINPSIVVHEIKTYPGIKPVQQKLHPVHPKKTVAIKEEVEKLLKYGFIYPVPLTEWVSNIVWSLRNKGPFVSALIIGILTRLVQKTITPHPSSTKSLIIALVALFSLSWMDSQDTTRLTFYLLINIRQPSSARGELSPIKTTIWSQKCWCYLPAGHVICFPRYQTYCGTLPR
jgi:hypothetical protein